MTNYIERYWRDATPEDAIKEPPMVARFRNNTSDAWKQKNFRLIGWSRLNLHSHEYLWYNDGIGCYGQCQVYDAPDPGEGWRLIDVENEEPQDGDEIYDPSTKQWTKRLSPFTPNVLSLNRRRITPTVTYVPFTWEDREQLRGRWIERDLIELQVTDLRYENGLYVDRIDADLLCKYWKFLDTGKPVGKEVTQ